MNNASMIQSLNSIITDQNSEIELNSNNAIISWYQFEIGYRGRSRFS